MSFTQIKLVIWLVLALAYPASFFAGQWRGKTVARAECREQALIAELQEAERQRRAGETALRLLQELLDEQGRQIAGLEAEADAYVAELQHGDACALTDDDVRRLRAVH